MYVIKTGVEEHKFLHMSSSTTEKKNKAILRHIYALASAAIIIAGLLSFTQSPVLATQTTTSNNNSDAAVQDTLEDARNSTALAQSRATISVSECWAIHMGIWSMNTAQLKWRK